VDSSQIHEQGHLAYLRDRLQAAGLNPLEWQIRDACSGAPLRQGDIEIEWNQSTDELEWRTKGRFAWRVLAVRKKEFGRQARRA
jgi:hypothetical protein